MKTYVPEPEPLGTHCEKDVSELQVKDPGVQVVGMIVAVDEVEVVDVVRVVPVAEVVVVVNAGDAEVEIEIEVVVDEGIVDEVRL